MGLFSKKNPPEVTKDGEIKRLHPMRPLSMPAKEGWSRPSSRPVSLTVPGAVAPPTLEETIARVMRAKQAQAIVARLAEEPETLEESDDFDVPDDRQDPATVYERAADAIPAAEMRRHLLRALDAKPDMWRRVKDRFRGFFSDAEVLDFDIKDEARATVSSAELEKLRAAAKEQAAKEAEGRK